MAAPVIVSFPADKIVQGFTAVIVDIEGRNRIILLCDLEDPNFYALDFDDDLRSLVDVFMYTFNFKTESRFRGLYLTRANDVWTIDTTDPSNVQSARSANLLQDNMTFD